MSPPQNPVRPVPVIRGSTEISSCGTVHLSARGSRGGGGREMDYQWSVCGGPGDLDLIQNRKHMNFIFFQEWTDVYVGHG